MTLKSLNVACIGAGVIGSGWVARLVLNGVNVTVFDKQKDSYKRTKEIIKRAAKSYSQLTEAPLRNHGKLTLTNSLEEAIVGSHYVIESLPENLNIKRDSYEEIQDISKDIPILSSTSGFKPSDLQHKIPSPQNLLVTHPFNPVYLMPLVEVVPGKEKNDSLIKTIMSLLKDIGMTPVLIKKEIDAFVADRMLESMWREGLWLIKDGICTTEELDQIITSGFGIRFAQMGMFESYRIAGGENGMRHFLDQFGPALQWPWSRLTDVPKFDNRLIEQICSQSDLQSGKYSISELEEIRDRNLVEIQKALKNNRWASGLNLSRYEKNLFDEQAQDAREKETSIGSDLLVSFSKVIPPEWADYNGHMTEYRYLNCFGDASDAVMNFIGCDKDYINNGNSYFTVETNIRHLKETKVGEEVYINTKILKGAEKKLHIMHLLKNMKQEVLATGEHLLLHVSLKTRKTCPASETIINNLRGLQKKHEEVDIGIEPKMII